MSEEFVVSISNVVTKIKNVLTTSIVLDHVWIQGEVSNLTKHRSGHYYFSLKDAHSELSCVMFSSAVSRLNFSLETGMDVLVKASVNVYEQRGSLQLVVRAMKPNGLGALYLEFEKRKNDLLRLGYFDDGHKLARPSIIGDLAIVTGNDTAALHDCMATIQKRWPMMQVTLYPCLVQGNNAPDTIISALKKADQNHHDAILIVRGGGSFEDLFCFNDVTLIKTIYDLKTYTVSGVGHEIDTTLCDLVCDHRALTPTAAAQWVSFDQEQMDSLIQSYQGQMFTTIKTRLHDRHAQLDRLMAHPYFQDPKQWIFEKQMRLDAFDQLLSTYKDRMSLYASKIHSLNDILILQAVKQKQNKHNELTQIQQSIQNAMASYFQENKKQFAILTSKLDAYSPLKTLSRGYAIATHDKTIIHSINDVDIDDKISVRVNDGSIEATIISKEKLS